MAYTFAAYGGGINSTAMLVGLVEKQEPLDLVIFSNTGGEKPETYAFLKLFDTWLEERSYPGIMRVRRVNKHGRPLTLEKDILRSQSLPSVAYGFKRCSEKFKTQPQEKFLNHWSDALTEWRHGRKLVKLVGYHVDERQRVDKALEHTSKKYELRFPLVEWGWDQDACKEAITRVGLPTPLKSACFFCPSSKKPEIIQLRRKHPKLYERALRIEDNARENMGSVKGLGRRFSWHDVDVPGLDSPIEEPCGCYDGEYES